MNATSLYVSTCRLVLQADVEDTSSWTDLYRLVPYLRQSLSCTVCGNLLIEPYTPTETNCQHHVCRSCKGGRKKLKPSCSWCKNYDKYVENVQLRILLQCYKKLCEYVTSTAIYRSLLVTAATTTNNCNTIDGTSSLTELIQEGAGFKDDFKSNAGLSKSAYSILPCVYTSTSTQTQTALAAASLGSGDINNVSGNDSPAIRAVSNGASLYSVMYPGNGNKITIKRKANDIEPEIDDESCRPEATMPMVPKVSKGFAESRASSIHIAGAFKKPPLRGSSHAKAPPPPPEAAPPRPSGGGGPSGKRKGCRCGNATPTPGKLTCCGQRCPCYVDSKACVECRCRGCRNPHRPGGQKVRPHIPELHNFQLQLSAGSSNDTPIACLEPQQTLSSLSNSTLQVLGVYTELGNVTSGLPAALLMGEDHLPSTESSDDTSDVEIDV